MISMTTHSTISFVASALSRKICLRNEPTPPCGSPVPFFEWNRVTGEKVKRIMQPLQSSSSPAASTNTTAMAATTAKPAKTTKENVTALDRGLQSLSTAESKTVAAEAFLAQQQKINYTKEKASSWHWRLAAILTVVGVVGFVVGNIAIQKYKFPQLFAWHARMRKQKTQGKWPNANYDFYQICTAMQFQPVATMLNLFTVWPMLPRVGAEFLALCVTNLGDMLGPLHWAGTAAQTGAANLLGDKGWASTGCPYDSGETIQTMQSNLINNWSGSRAHNIWFPLFPDPRADPNGFLNLCVFKELWKVGGKACPPHGRGWRHHPRAQP